MALIVDSGVKMQKTKYGKIDAKKLQADGFKNTFLFSIYTP